MKGFSGSGITGARLDAPAVPAVRGARIVFLDIDGVLNHEGTSHRVNEVCDDADHGMLGVSPECIAALSHLVLITGAEIVVSSTWRKLHSLGRIERMLRRHGYVGPRIFEQTPRLGGLARGFEIQAWLDTQEVKPEAFVILDDDDDMAHLLHRLVRCNPYAGGLTKETAARAIAMLHGGPRG